MLFQIILISITMVDHQDSFDPYNRGQGGPIWPISHQSSSPSPHLESVWESLGSSSVGILGGLAVGATAYLFFRCWASRKFLIYI